MIQDPIRPALRVDWEGRDYRGGDVIEFNLTALQTVQLQANSDFSGSEVWSDKPIAVFSGESGCS